MRMTGSYAFPLSREAMARLWTGALRILVCQLLAAKCFSAVPVAHASDDCVGVALVIAIDASASVSPDEFSLVHTGIAEAFRNHDVLTSIRATGKVAVSIIIWASDGLQKPETAWSVIETPQDAEQFARVVDALSRQVTGDTGLGAGMTAALSKLEHFGTCARRRVINVSGDGAETLFYRQRRKSLAPSQVRDRAASEGIEINALVVSDEESGIADYYARNVITGPDAFVMRVTRYQDIAVAIRRKLIRELDRTAVAQSRSGDGAGDTSPGAGAYRLTRMEWPGHHEGSAP